MELSFAVILETIFSIGKLIIAAIAISAIVSFVTTSVWDLFEINLKERRELKIVVLFLPGHGEFLDRD